MSRLEQLDELRRETELYKQTFLAYARIPKNQSNSQP
jgi:hypothetical protein